MGYSLLYVAFGIVALWLLGEVLLQYKARLRWRVLAFTGFLGVVAGVYERQVLLIVLGAAAFGTGQTFVTLSYKRGFSTGWALGGRPGASRRRRAGEAREPVLEVTAVEPDFGQGAPAGQDVLADESDPAALHRPVPMHEDSGEYPLYDGQSSYTPDPYTSGGYDGYGTRGYEWGTGEPQPAAAAASYDSGGYGGGYEQSGGWTGDQGYGYAADQGQGAGYGYPQQTTAATSYDQGYGGGYQDGGYGQQATGDWTPQAHSPNGRQDQGDQGDPYASYGYGQQPPPQAPAQPHSQPYIPPQPHQSPYEQQVQQPAQHYDPYDPYRS
ncbi:hypothetical protein [Actinacidiphila rubida]|uniref:Uncharacterized protein n=1 Tax=Actinacidiphila rubida TaxID=310780 RepID=A0A1H8IN57_9ACTN|nr:hypothetical protein [Actinacidiphila rubida]SEN69741.1 hypothetical protein SAMN05216267_1008158 [Actinacidiphila rubida]